jgi:hypothetical protein
MSLTLNRETLAGLRPLFAKVLETFTGGFAWTAGTLTRHTDGVTLPAGTLLVVNEATRQARPVKRARLLATQATAVATATVEKGHMFEVDDIIIAAAANAGTRILNIVVGAASDQIVVGTAVATCVVGATGAALYEIGTTTATGAFTALIGTANSIALYPSTIEAGASVTALRRGTVYANRIQPVNAVQDNLPAVIQLSTSA